MLADGLRKFLEGGRKVHTSRERNQKRRGNQKRRRTGKARLFEAGARRVKDGGRGRGKGGEKREREKRRGSRKRRWRQWALGAGRWRDGVGSVCELARAAAEGAANKKVCAESGPLFGRKWKNALPADEHDRGSEIYVQRPHVWEHCFRTACWELLSGTCIVQYSTVEAQRQLPTEYSIHHSHSIKWLAGLFNALRAAANGLTSSNPCPFAGAYQNFIIRRRGQYCAYLDDIVDR
jgi:hypothetical protein